MTLTEKDVEVCKAIGARDDLTLGMIANRCAWNEIITKQIIDRLVRGYAVVAYRDRKEKKFPALKYKLSPSTLKFLVEEGEITLDSKKDQKNYPATNFMKLLAKA